MSDHGHELIIIRRHEEEEHEHHSSAWKVAHADFMTAMMAFFLIMWLINVTDQDVRKGISEYFNPIHLSQGQTEMKGLNQPDAGANKSGAKTGHNDKTQPPAFNPVQLSQGLAEAQKPSDRKDIAPPKPEVAKSGQTGSTNTAAAGTAEAASAATGGNVGEGATPNAGTEKGSLAAKERAAFQDPYAILSKLAHDYRATQTAPVDVTAGEGVPQAAAPTSDNDDPFDPTYWQSATAPPADAAPPLEREPTAADQGGAKDAAGKGVGGKGTGDAAKELGAKDAAAKDAVANADKAGPGLTPVAPGATVTAATPAEAPPAAAAKAAPDAAVVAEAKSLSAALIGAVKDALAAGPSPEISVKATAEGILINLTDDSDFSMFQVGSAIPDPKVVVLMERVAKALSGLPGDVVIRGHTDGRPFHSDVYDNWRLSAARAHMAYYMLTRGGLDEHRVLRIEGYADRDLKDAADPLAAQNRRIEILIKGAKT